MKHAHDHSGGVEVNVNLPTQDAKDLIDHVASSAMVVIGFYMAADMVRSIVKSTFK